MKRCPVCGKRISFWKMRYTRFKKMECNNCKTKFELGLLPNLITCGVAFLPVILVYSIWRYLMISKIITAKRTGVINLFKLSLTPIQYLVITAIFFGSIAFLLGFSAGNIIWSKFIKLKVVSKN